VHLAGHGVQSQTFITGGIGSSVTVLNGKPPADPSVNRTERIEIPAGHQILSEDPSSGLIRAAAGSLHSTSARGSGPALQSQAAVPPSLTKAQMINKYVSDLNNIDIPKLSNEMQNKKYHHKFSKFFESTERINLM
jgi:hypothetical protein